MIKPENMTYSDLIKAIALVAIKVASARNPKRRNRAQSRLSALEAEQRRRDGVA